MVFKQFKAMVKARTMEFIRDRGTFIWNLLFPIMLVGGFAIGFSGNDQALFKVGVLGQVPANYPLVSLAQVQSVPFSGQDGEKARESLRQHKLDLVLDLDTKVWLINELSKNGQFLASSYGSLFEAQGLAKDSVEGTPIRYVDWLVPGIIGMNMMFASLFGVGYVLVRYRKNGVLKRMKATPVSALNFVGAQAVSRLLIVLVTAVVVFLGTSLMLKFPMRGSYFDLFILTVLAVLSMIAFGLVFASRFKSEELAGGLLNLITFPMILLSGVFVSLEGSPEPLQLLAKASPLTHFIDGARQIMLEGSTMGDLAPSYIFLALFTAACLSLAALLFRWE